jgi:hypothetical protein
MGIILQKALDNQALQNAKRPGIAVLELRFGIVLEVQFT